MTREATATTTHKYTRETAKCIGPYCVSASNPALYMTAVEFSDLPEMVRILNLNQDVYNGSALFLYPFLESHGQEKIQKAHDHIFQEGINTHWAMRESASSDSPLIGWAHLHLDHYDEKYPQPLHPVTGKPLVVADIGYWLSPEHTGKGLAARVGKFLVEEIAFKDMGCDIVRAVSYVENWPSRKVAERAGMQLELASKSILIPKLGVFRDICTYASHKDEATRHIVKENYDY